MSRAGIACAFALCWSLSSGPAGAQAVDDATRASARQLGEEGNELFDRGDFAGALDRYDRASKLVSVPTLGLKAARSLVKLGRLVEASERYLTVTRMKLPPDALPVHAQAITDAETERNALQPRIPSVVIQIEGAASAEVTLDGKPVPAALLGAKRSVDPGSHHIEGRVGAQAQSRDVTVKEGETASVSLKFDPTQASAAEPPPAVPGGPPGTPDRGREAPSSTQKWIGVTGIALGGVGIGVGVIVGLIASGAKSDLETNCGANLECGPDFHGDADAYNTKRTISTIGFVAGGVLAAAGVTLVLTAPSAPAEVAIAPGRLTLRARF